MGVGFHFLLQAVFPTWESNPWLLSPAPAGGFFTMRATGKPRHSRPESLHPVAPVEVQQGFALQSENLGLISKPQDCGGRSMTWMGFDHMPGLGALGHSPIDTICWAQGKPSRVQCFWVGGLVESER